MSDDLISVRNLVDSDFDIPVRSCDAVFDSYETAPATGYDGTRVNLNFKDLENIVSVTPYNLPTLVINMGLSNKHKSMWGYFGDSVAALLPPDEDIKDCKGRKFHLVLTDGIDGRPAGKPIWNKEADRTLYPNGEVPKAVWIVTAIDGASAGATTAAGGNTASAAEIATVGLLGKTRAEFNKWALDNATIKKDVALQRAIMDKSFIQGLITLGKVAEDENGIFVVPEL